MKICHVTCVHNHIDDRIFYRECLSLVKAGYDVFEIAPNIDDCEIEGVKIFGVEVSKSKWKRALFFPKNVYNKCVKVNADVYHFHDPELVPVGVKLKKKYNKIVVFDSHEDVPAQILTKEWLPAFLRKPISKLYAFYEKQMLRHYDALVSVTPIIIDRLKKINVNTFQITNFPFIENYSIDTREWDDSICFAGTISSERLHHNILKALQDVPNVKYRLAGWGADTYFAELKKYSAWQKVEYVGCIPFTDVNKFISKSSIGIVINDYYANVGYKQGTLGIIKFFEFMQMGLPVICTDFILWKEIIDEWKCGICVNPHDIDAIRNAIVYLIENKDIAKQMGDNGRRAVMEKYNWNTQEKILLEMYKKLEEKCK